MAPRPEPGEGGWITLARLDKTQGRRGELAATSLTDVAGRFEALAASGAEVRLAHPDGRCRPAHVTRAWPHQGRIVLGFTEIGDLNAAGPWVGAQVQLPAAERAPAPPGQYFIDDLIGCELLDGARPVGTITAVEPVAGAAPLLHVDRGDNAGEALIPFVEEYLIAVLLPERTIRMRLPEGLLELGPDSGEAGSHAL